ncbi:hypothetical protein [Haloglycomyces albus]|uniref:hypothetical protein n=1 Tax=Haloglycomyces albus TaxID=526067 RepID=UPI00046D1DDF|nr:hypothetical protein [Haloglycomyces albus]
MGNTMKLVVNAAGAGRRSDPDRRSRLPLEYFRPSGREQHGKRVSATMIHSHADPLSPLPVDHSHVDGPRYRHS